MCFFWGEIQLIREDTEGTVLDINLLKPKDIYIYVVPQR